MKKALSAKLLAEWDYEKNTLSPDAVSTGSEKAVWWRCERGHSYQAVVYARAAGCGCPYCAGKRAIAGETDLATTNPELLAEWGTENRLTPQEITAGSHKSIWWHCEKGHRWQAAPYSRARGAECPYCTNRRVLTGFNDLGTTDPNVAGEWDKQRNGSLTPQKVTRGSNKRVWWQCKSGHVWQAAIFSRTRKRPAGCPICSGKVKQLRPLLKNETRKGKFVEIHPNDWRRMAVK